MKRDATPISSSSLKITWFVLYAILLPSFAFIISHCVLKYQKHINSLDFFSAIFFLAKDDFNDIFKNEIKVKI